jgi:hypothetical protein
MAARSGADAKCAATGREYAALGERRGRREIKRAALHGDPKTAGTGGRSTERTAACRIFSGPALIGI